MIPETNLPFWMAATAFLSKILIVPIVAVGTWFHLRVSRLENKKCNEKYVPRPEYEKVVSMIESNLKDIKYGVTIVGKRIDDHFRGDRKP